MNDPEVLIIGGGPAGSCAAAILAEYGHRVLLLEREKFPRYHIGESLIPFTFEPLQRIGMIEKMRKLVYAFYNPAFSFKSVIQRYPDAADEITDCLSGDVNKDFSRLWNRIREFVPLPEDLPYGDPLLEAPGSAQFVSA